MYERFIFDSYIFDKEKNAISLHYSLDDKVFLTESVELPQITPGVYNQNLFERALFNFHLIAGISYYKTYCPHTIQIRSGTLGEYEASFWNTLYTKGLGEFFYKNTIDFRGLVSFPFEKRFVAKAEHIPETEKILLPIGGGRDSFVSADLLRARGYDFDLFTVGNAPLFQQAENIIGKKRFIIKRTLDPLLLELNQKGAYNGHVPITAYNSFVGILVAVQMGYEYIIFSNEQSSSEGNVEYLGEEINHQYSKSFEFETSLADHIRNTLTPNIKLFSLLRPFSGLKIAELFSSTPQYFPIFKSCNRNFKRNASFNGWCKECPKCASMFLSLAAFLPKQTLIDIFGKDLLDEKLLEPTYWSLLGETGIKPFECVSTRDETLAAFWLISERGDFKNSSTLKRFEEELKNTIQDPKALVEKVLVPSQEHHIPQKFISIVKKVNEVGRS